MGADSHCVEVRIQVFFSTHEMLSDSSVLCQLKAGTLTAASHCLKALRTAGAVLVQAHARLWVPDCEQAFAQISRGRNSLVVKSCSWIEVNGLVVDTSQGASFADGILDAVCVQHGRLAFSALPRGSEGAQDVVLSLLASVMCYTSRSQETVHILEYTIPVKTFGNELRVYVSNFVLRKGVWTDVMVAAYNHGWLCCMAQARTVPHRDYRLRSMHKHKMCITEVGLHHCVSGPGCEMRCEGAIGSWTSRL